MPDESRDDAWKQILHTDAVWQELFADLQFWQHISSLPEHEQAKACLARLDALGLGESRVIEEMRIRQMAGIAALIRHVGVETALEMVRETRH